MAARKISTGVSKVLLSASPAPLHWTARPWHGMVQAICDVLLGTAGVWVVLTSMPRRPSHTGRLKMRTPGVEPGSQAWEACMMPLHYVRRCYKTSRAILHSWACQPSCGSVGPWAVGSVAPRKSNYFVRWAELLVLRGTRYHHITAKDQDKQPRPNPKRWFIGCISWRQQGRA